MKQLDARIQNIEHDIDGWWIYLKPGFVVSDERTHAIVETTKRAALNKMPLVERCECGECRRLLSIIGQQKAFS